MSAQLKIHILFLLTILFTANASAEKLYKSSSENGTLVFSDRPVENAQVLQVEQIEVAKQFCFSISQRGSEEDVQLYGVNDCYGPVEFQFVMKESRNMSWDRPRKYEAVVPARKSRPLVHMWQADRRKGYKYSYATSFVPGDPKAGHYPLRPYLVPVQPGRAYRITQGFNGKSTHTHPQSLYAVDIAMPEGSRICAARGGVIMEVANDFFTGGKSDRFAERANFIRILHDDGTMAIYAHLKLESIQYPPGTRVERGQFIAESGNTGYSSGPHLHFVIQKNVGMELRSIPFEFADSGGGAFTPEMGMVVRR